MGSALASSSSSTSSLCTSASSRCRASRWRAAHARRQTVRDYKKLLTVDEHLLSDIGLTRYDIRRAIVECERAR